MDKPQRISFGSKISKWENNFMERHPGFFYGITEVIAEVMVACALALFAFHMLPPDLNCTVSKKTPSSCVLSITNEGFIYASGEYGIKTKKFLTKDPEVISGKKYVDSLKRRGKDDFYLQLSGLPYKKQIKVQFKTGHIRVDEE